MINDISWQRLLYKHWLQANCLPYLVCKHRVHCSVFTHIPVYLETRHYINNNNNTMQCSHTEIESYENPFINSMEKNWKRLSNISKLHCARCCLAFLVLLVVVGCTLCGSLTRHFLTINQENCYFLEKVCNFCKCIYQ